MLARPPFINDDGRMSENAQSWDGLKACLKAGRDLVRRVNRLKFSEPVHTVYNPMEYAWESHRAYLQKFSGPRCRILFLGMNPGPWGMTQTGIPFGEIDAVRNWLGIEVPVGQPPSPHPKRPVEGFSCSRSEVSGRRLWGLFAARFGKAEEFFRHHFVLNHCPLVFMEAGGKNRTPDKLPAEEGAPLMEASDDHLKEMVRILQPEWVVGVGAYAEDRARRVLEGKGVRFARILHPSPASPAANRDWAATATRQLMEAGVWPHS